MTSAAWFDGHGLLLPPARGSVEERRLAQLTAARAAQGNADNLRHLLDVLGLWPSQDAAVASDRTPTIWGTDYVARRRRTPASPPR